MAVSNEQVMLQVNNLKKYFPVKKRIDNIFRKKQYVKAVNDISFNVRKGETYGLVGESGCGKSTTGRTIMNLTNATSGNVFLENKNISKMPKKEFKTVRKRIQMVFQDMYSSLNPRKKIGETLIEPLIIHSIGNKQSRVNKVIKVLEDVGLGYESYFKYPHEFSGGQRQRIGIARALILKPDIIIHDEPVSALDVSIQSQILNLLNFLQKKEDLTYLFIAHDISVVRHISDRIGIMYLGKIVEESPTDDLFRNPLHPYTEALFSAIPIPNPNKKRERIVLNSEIPSPLNPPKGCVFHNRCPYAMDICKKVEPTKKEMSLDKFVACHLYN